MPLLETRTRKRKEREGEGEREKERKTVGQAIGDLPENNLDPGIQRGRRGDVLLRGREKEGRKEGRKESLGSRVRKAGETIAEEFVGERWWAGGGKKKRNKDRW